MNFKKNNSSRGYTNLILLFLIILIVGAIGYIGFIKFRSNSKDLNISNKDSMSSSSEKDIRSKVSSQNSSKISLDMQSKKDEEIKTFSRTQTLNISQIQFKIDSLIKSMNEILVSVKQNDLSLVSGMVDNYQSNFKAFALGVDKLDLSKTDKKSVENLRASEWSNYKLFEELRGKTSSNSILSQKNAEIKKTLDDYLKSQSLKSLEFISIKPKKTAFSNYRKNLSWLLFGSVINSAMAEESSDVVHKKVVKESSDLDMFNSTFFQKNTEHIGCWKYESWIDLNTGDLHQEKGGWGSVSLGVNPSDGKCYDVSEINLIQGSTGKKLALAPIVKYAEWLNPPKFGIGSEAKADPYTKFKNDLESGEWKIESTDTLNNEKVYVLRGHEPPGNFPSGLKKPYDILYLDATTYFPVRQISYIDKMMVLNGVPSATLNGGDENENIAKYNEIVELWKDKEMISGDIFDFVTAEIINRDSLASDWFDLVIPEGYEMKEFVPFG